MDFLRHEIENELVFFSAQLFLTIPKPPYCFLAFLSRFLVSVLGCHVKLNDCKSIFLLYHITIKVDK